MSIAQLTFPEMETAPELVMRRTWAMPSADTFSIPPIDEFVMRYLHAATVSIDPFARNNWWPTYTNDLDPQTRAACHMDAEAFLLKLAGESVKADLLLFDPPYSPRQISEVYRSIGQPCGMADTQNAMLYKRVRDAAMRVLSPQAIVLSFGWNSAGMGKKRGFKLIELLLVAHGGAHNDTICIAERRVV